MPMPEASTGLNGSIPLLQNALRFSGQAPVMLAEAESLGVHRPVHSQLRLRVLSTNLPINSPDILPERKVTLDKEHIVTTAVAVATKLERAASKP